MDSGFRKQLKALLHPYLFILKEGGTINNDLLDYSLLMLRVDCADRLRSPKIQALPVTSSKPQKEAPLTAEAVAQATTMQGSVNDVALPF